MVLRKTQMRKWKYVHKDVSVMIDLDIKPIMLD